MLTCLMRLTLFVPGLLLPREILSDTVFDLTAPALSLLLGRARRETFSRDWLEENHGIATRPAAALRKVGAGGTVTAKSDCADFGEGSREQSERYAETKVGAGGTAEGEWLCLDPVHFDVRREGIILADPARLDLQTAEAAALIAAVQALFVEWGEISASTPGRWELRLARPLVLDTQPLAEAIDRPVHPGLPGGADGREWRRLLAEAQTILHAHPLNRERERAGRPTVSSLWPWGQGGLPATAASAFTEIWSDDPVLAGLCALAGTAGRALPERFHAIAGDVLAIQPALRHPAAARDALGWRSGLLSLEHNWLAPALAALRQGDCDEFRLVGNSMDDTSRCVALTLTRGRLRRFWQRPRPLTELA